MALTKVTGSVLGETDSTDIDYTHSATDAVERTLQSKLGDIVSVKDFGAAGDGETNDTIAIQAAVDSGGLVFFPPGTYMITEITISEYGTYLIGSGSRGTSLDYIGSGSLVNGMVNFINSTTHMMFSCGVEKMSIRAMGSAYTPLYIVGTQENCYFNDIVCSKTTASPIKVVSWGNHSGGADSATPAHLSTFSNLHLIPDATTPDKGIELTGVQDCTFMNITCDVPNNAVFGNEGLYVGAESHNNIFINIHLEDFERPVEIVAGCKGNEFKTLSMSASGATLAGTETAINVGAGCSPLDIAGIRFTGTAYNTVFDAADSPVTVMDTNLENNRYNHIAISQTDNNGAAVVRATFEGDHIQDTKKLVKHTNVYYQPEATLTADATTPAVNDRNVFKTANTVATNISNFASGVNGQVIDVVVLDSNTTFVHGASLNTNTGANVVASSGDCFRFVRTSNTWYMQ